ncbi:MAG: penicillin-binding protein 2 [Burkholderiales bacterium]|jgi:penicillin-binding protein 2|nr:penicillin-binding protein 2 [Burkholderiales bacterium]
MKVFRNPQQEVDLFRSRVVVAALVVLAAFAALAARFVWLQVIKHDELHQRAEAQRTALVPVTANRGLIHDRNGIVIAENFSAYTLEINPRQVGDVAAVVDELATVVDIQPRDRRRFKKLADELKGAESIPIRTRLSDEEVARFTAQRYRFPGVELRARLFRHYPLGEVGSHMVGHIGRISPADKERIERWSDAANYAGAEYIGKTGIEASYQRELHGTTGMQEVEITAGGRAVRTLTLTPPVAGNALRLSIDIRLQEVVERAFEDRRGALIAIEPATGDVLAFVSMPTVDPNLFVDGIDPKVWEELNADPDKPLLNRALRGTYPIGSTYKPFLALAALETGKRRPEQVINDPGFFMYGGRRFRDSNKVPLGAVDLHRSIVKSSDIYYYMLADDLGVDTIHDFMKPWGFGQITGIDIDGEMTGILPSSEWKLRRFKQKWYGGETISIGIGQGYNAFTLLQLAHATATLANDGVVMKPHLVKIVEDAVTGEQRPTVPAAGVQIPVRQEHIRIVREAMVDVNISGTGRTAFAGAPYKVAGKTGTAQVVGIKANEKYDASKIDERHRDHSLYIAFAPAGPGEKPVIAIAALVENAGFGARAAAPIVRAAIDYYLLGKLPPAMAPLKSDRLPPEAAQPRELPRLAQAAADAP